MNKSYVRVGYLFLIGVAAYLVLVIPAAMLIGNLSTKLERADQTVLELRSDLAELNKENQLLLNAVKMNAEQQLNLDILEFSAYIYEVDLNQLRAIMQYETGFSSDAWLDLNNPAGITDPVTGELIRYSTKNQGIVDFARRMRVHYYDKGLTTVEQIGQYWCPPSIEVCSNWINSVNQIIEENSLYE